MAGRSKPNSDYWVRCRSVAAGHHQGLEELLSTGEDAGVGLLYGYPDAAVRSGYEHAVLGGQGRYYDSLPGGDGQGSVSDRGHTTLGRADQGCLSGAEEGTAGDGGRGEPNYAVDVEFSDSDHVPSAEKGNLFSDTWFG